MPRTRVLAGAVVVGVVALLATAAPASAHDELLSSDPAENAVLETAPDQVTLTFSGELLDLGAAIIVADADDTDWAAGEPVLDGTDISVPVEAGMPDAGYEVRWRVVSSDGHPISGVIPFVVGDGSPLVRDSDVDDSAAEDPAADDSAAGGTPAQTPPSDDGTGRVLLVGAGGALLALAVLFLFSRTRRRGTAAASDAQDESSAAPSDSPERH